MSQEPKVYRKDRKIVIEMPEDNLIFAVENSPRYNARVTNREFYLNAVSAALPEYTLGTDDDPMLFRLFDNITEDMLENGDSGIEPTDQ